jgi:hypothetical protein
MAVKRQRSWVEPRLRCPMAKASRWGYLCRQVPLRNLFAHAAAGRCWDRGGREHQVLDKKSGSEDACRCGHRTRRHQCRNTLSAQMADAAMSRSSDVLTRLQLGCSKHSTGHGLADICTRAGVEAHRPWLCRGHSRSSMTTHRLVCGGNALIAELSCKEAPAWAFAQCITRGLMTGCGTHGLDALRYGQNL